MQVTAAYSKATRLISVPFLLRQVECTHLLFHMTWLYLTFQEHNCRWVLSSSWYTCSVFHSNPSPEQFKEQHCMRWTPKMLKKTTVLILILILSSIPSSCQEYCFGLDYYFRFDIQITELGIKSCSRNSALDGLLQVDTLSSD